jgi:flagellar basal-body rod protein FlgF
MNNGIYSAAASMSALERWQEATSMNLAAGSVAGFRGNQMSFEAIQNGVVGIESAGQSVALPTSMSVPTSSFNFSSGDIHQTDGEAHVAIDGEGFFHIQGDGYDYYTRDGEFHINGDDTLVTKNGDAVLGRNGNPIKINPQLGRISISANGEVSQNDTPAGQLAVFSFDDTNQLVRAPGGFRINPNSDMNATPIVEPRVIQGSLEDSNVSPMHEMVNLISISRAFELNQKVIQSLDDIQGKTIEVMGSTG